MGCKKCKQKKIKDIQKNPMDYIETAQPVNVLDPEEAPDKIDGAEWDDLPEHVQDGILHLWAEDAIKKTWFGGKIPKKIKSRMKNLKSIKSQQMNVPPNTEDNPLPPIPNIPMPENLESEESDDDRKTGEEYNFPHNEVIGDMTGSFLIRLVTFAVVAAALPLIIVALMVQLFLTFFLPKSVNGINKKFKGFLSKIFIKYGEFKIKKERKKRDRQFFKNRGYDADSELLDIEVFDEGLDNKKTEVN